MQARIRFRGKVCYAPGPWGAQLGIQQAAVEILDQDAFAQQVIWRGSTDDSGQFFGVTDEWQSKVRIPVWIWDDKGSVFPPRAPRGHWESRDEWDPTDIPLLFARIAADGQQVTLPFIVTKDGDVSALLYTPWLGATPDAGAVVEDVHDLVDGGADTGEAVFREYVVEPIGALADAAVERAEEVKETVEEVIGAAADLTDLDEQVAEALKTAEDALVAAVDAVQDAAGEAADHLTDLFASYDMWLAAAAGDPPLDWLTDGLSDAREWLCGTAMTMANEFVAAGEEQLKAMVRTQYEFLEHQGPIGRDLAHWLAGWVYPWLMGTLLEDLDAQEPWIMDEFAVEKRPAAHKWVVFSDLHMFTPGPLDNFNNRGNAAIYRAVLEHYDAAGYGLIENGDIEDYWMWDQDHLVYTVASVLPWPYFADAFRKMMLSELRRMHACNIIRNNSSVYLASARFASDPRLGYVRVVGNHDAPVHDGAVQDILRVNYPSLRPASFCLLTDGDGKTRVIISHGHHAEWFNAPATSFAGEFVTGIGSAANLTLDSELLARHDATFGKTREKWEAELAGGLKNVVSDLDLAAKEAFSELDLHEDYTDIYPDGRAGPLLIIGHTHHVKVHPRVRRDGRSETWDAYANSGTAGMWGEAVIGLELEYPTIRAVLWRHVDGELQSTYLGEVDDPGAGPVLKPA